MRCSVSGIFLLMLALSPAITSAQAPCNNGTCGPEGGYYESEGAPCDNGECYAGDCDGAGGRGGRCRSMIESLRARCQSGECVQRGYGCPDLFYNFYVGPNCGSEAAQMYIAPHPVPAYVGHTFYTYQPLYPHEMLYPHSRFYHRYYDEGRGLNRTRVRWSRSPAYMAQNMMSAFAWPR